MAKTKSEIMTERWKNPEWRKKMITLLKGNKFGLGYKHSKKEIEKIRQASKNLWKNPRYRDKMMKVAKTPNQGQFKKGFTPWNKNKKFSKGKIGKEFYKGTRKRIKKINCKWCLITTNLELDHIIPRKKGGSNDDSNCQVLCRKCNLLKRNLIDYPEHYKGFKEKLANSGKLLKLIKDNPELS